MSPLPPPLSRYNALSHSVFSVGQMYYCESPTGTLYGVSKAECLNPTLYLAWNESAAASTPVPVPTLPVNTTSITQSPSFMPTTSNSTTFNSTNTSAPPTWHPDAYLKTAKTTLPTPTVYTRWVNYASNFDNPGKVDGAVRLI